MTTRIEPVSSDSVAIEANPSRSVDSDRNASDSVESEPSTFRERCHIAFARFAPLSRAEFCKRKGMQLAELDAWLDKPAKKGPFLRTIARAAEMLEVEANWLGFGTSAETEIRREALGELFREFVIASLGERHGVEREQIEPVLPPAAAMLEAATAAYQPVALLVRHLAR
jgi:hypothetical protein